MTRSESRHRPNVRTDQAGQGMPAGPVRSAVLVWLRDDLRVDDQRALQAAVAEADAHGLPVHAVWCAVSAQWDAHGMGNNRRWFLLASARELVDTLADAGIALHVLDAGDFAGSITGVLALAESLKVHSIHLNREYPVNEVRRDAAFTSAAVAAGIAVHEHDDGMLVPPKRVLSKAGTPYAVFTPYRQAWYQALAEDANAEPRDFRAPQAAVPTPLLASVRRAAGLLLEKLQASTAAAASVQQLWLPGEAEARRRLSAFVTDAIGDYHEQRDLPAVPGTSTLSPYLAAGCLSPRRALAAARMANRGDIAEGNPGVVTWISELAWRDFYRQVMHNNPHVGMGRAFRRDTDGIAWRQDPADFSAWCEGRTGYPLVDAAMQQLVATGWMHNRLRMVAAMFLSKDLLIDWRMGEAFFARHLIDWDYAANNGGWQWSASTGTDAAPYFRLFSPVRQGERFDPEGTFVRHWLPALRDLPAKQVHTPPRDGLFAVEGYPLPIIDHAQAKARVMAAFRSATPAT